jgi:prolipoprotein diacylglyceryltransferase
MALNTYTLWVTLAVMTGGVWVLWQVRHSWPVFSAALNAMLVSALVSMLFGRAGYVLLHLDYFQEHLNEIISSASPGLWEHACLMGWLVGGWIAHRLHQNMPLNSACVLMTLAGVGASAGCIPAVCAYGREVFWTDGWLWQLRVDWPDATLINNPRLPTQLFMLIWLLVCLRIVWVAHTRHWRYSQGNRALALWVILFAVGDFIIQFARADLMPVFGLLRAAQWADVALVLLGASLLNPGNQPGMSRII